MGPGQNAISGFLTRPESFGTSMHHPTLINLSADVDRNMVGLCMNRHRDLGRRLPVGVLANPLLWVAYALYLCRVNWSPVTNRVFRSFVETTGRSRT
jgi:hypothetical protein